MSNALTVVQAVHTYVQVYRECLEEEEEEEEEEEDR